MSDKPERWKVPLIVWVGFGVLSLAVLIALALFVPRLAWLGTVLLVVALVAMTIGGVNRHSQRILDRYPGAERYRDFMAAFGVKRNGRTMGRSDQDFPG